MYNFAKYNLNKSELLTKIDDVKSKISELEGFGLDVSETIKKIENAKAIINNDKLSVVLVGAFSDGKTSVVAGWLNEQLDSMKIDSDESSDEILCYAPNSIPKGCQIVDTPGLFGDKIGSDENGARIALSEKTKKYISEAALILYVVAAKNPIKDSHKECIRWILKDLNKFSSTIFVINRMDDVADMTDDDDYALQARIKSDNLRGKLLDCGLTPEEIQKVKIACISADPDGKGMDVWKEYREEYLRRSRLKILENTTNEVLRNSEEHLILKTGCDVLAEEINKTLDAIREEVSGIETVILPEQKETLSRNKKDLNQLSKRLLQSRLDIIEDLRKLEKRKISAIRAATMDNFKEFLEDEIGISADNNGECKDGYRLDQEINLIFQQYFAKHSQWTNGLANSMQQQYERQDELVQSLLSKSTGVIAKSFQGVKYLGTDALKKGIFAGRDLLSKLGKTIKFKPWQVTKMACFASKALPIVGTLLTVISDIVSDRKEQKRQKQFQEAKDSLNKEIMGIFQKTVADLNNDTKFFADFVPDYGELVHQIQKDEEAICQQEQMLKAFKAWQESMNRCDFKFN